jgi:WD40 repeat protein
MIKIIICCLLISYSSHANEKLNVELLNFLPTMHVNEISDFIFLENKKILTAGYDGYLKEINYDTGESKIIYSHQHWIYRIAISPSKKYLAFSGSKTMNIYILNLETRKVVRVLNGLFDREHFLFHPKKDILFYSRLSSYKIFSYDIVAMKINSHKIFLSKEEAFGFHLHTFSNSGDTILLTSKFHHYLKVEGIPDKAYKKIYLAKLSEDQLSSQIMDSFDLNGTRLLFSRKTYEDFFLMLVDGYSLDKSSIYTVQLNMGTSPMLVESNLLNAEDIYWDSISISNKDNLIVLTKNKTIYFADLQGNILHTENVIHNKQMKAKFSPWENILIITSQDSAVSVWKYELN